MDCSLPGSFLCPWDFPGKNTGVGCHFLLQGIFLTQGSDPPLLLCRWTLYHLVTRKAHKYYIYWKKKKNLYINGLMQFKSMFSKGHLQFIKKERYRNILLWRGGCSSALASVLTPRDTATKGASPAPTLPKPVYRGWPQHWTGGGLMQVAWIVG